MIDILHDYVDKLYPRAFEFKGLRTSLAVVCEDYSDYYRNNVSNQQYFVQMVHRVLERYEVPDNEWDNFMTLKLMKETEKLTDKIMRGERLYE